MASPFSHSWLLIAVSTLFILFLCSTTSYPDVSTKDRHSDTTLLASKALLHKHDINAYLSPHIYNVFINQAYQFEEVAAGGLDAAESCLEQAKQFCWNNEKLHVAQVSFSTTDVKWTLCHCSNLPHEEPIIKGVCHPEPWSYLLSHLARIPTRLRQQVQTIMLAPLSRSPIANRPIPSTSSNISDRDKETTALPHGMFTAFPSVVTFFGCPSIGTWIHEFAHSVDFHHSIAMFSASSSWKRALELDSCVADGYAKTSREEALAQAAIVKAYLTGSMPVPNVHPSKSTINNGFPEMTSRREYFDPLIGDYSCMKHQLLALDCLEKFHTFTRNTEQCTGLGNVGDDIPAEADTDLVPWHGTWWEMWLVTDMLIILIILAQL